MSDDRIGSDYVQWNGRLGGSKVLRRETIYKSLKGTKVERFYDAENSYIYKPLGFEQNEGHEWWVQETVVPLLKSIRVPRILAASRPGESSGHWLIYEDLGDLKHCTEPKGIIEAAGWIPEWHRLPVKLVPEQLSGHTPFFHDVWIKVLADIGCPQDLQDRMPGIDPVALNSWLRWLPEAGARIGTETVVSHGDYHPYNVSAQNGERIVLDWEFIHRNHPYWDLYSLLDITSFRYSKVSLTQDERMQALRRYWEQSSLLDGSDSGIREHWDAFLHGYYAYASVYSAWITGLIINDLLTGEIPREALLKQQKETLNVFIACLNGLGILEIKE